MPKRQNKRNKRRRRYNRRTQNTRSNQVGGQAGVFVMPRLGRSIPTAGRMANAPFKVALYRTPLFPSAVMQRNMLYYDYNLSVTMPNTGQGVNYFFSANGAWDPDITGTGHQLMGYDQMMALYNQATVVRSTITVTFVPGHQYRGGIALAPDTTAIIDPQRIIENGLITTIAGPTGVTQNRLPSMTQHCDVRKYLGRRTFQDLLNDDKLYSTASANPTEQVYYQLMWWQALGINATQNITFDVCLSFDIIFWEPKRLAVS